MFSWILALVLAIAVWAAITAYLWLIQRRKEENQAGLKAIANLHWREFFGLVRRALEESRGWTLQHEQPLQESATSAGTGAEVVMQAEDGRWLLSCKHGRAYRIGAAAVNELGSAARLASAKGGLLLTEGLVEREGLAAAQRQSIEILDGRTLWPMLKPYMPAEIENRIIHEARRTAIRYSGIAALVSVALGLAVGMSYLSSTGGSQPAAGHSVAATTPTTVKPAKSSAKPADDDPSAAKDAGTATQPGKLDGDPDEVTLVRYQREVLQALAAIPGVTRGYWQTRLTLAIDREAPEEDIWKPICTEVERYPALRTVRIQLNPRPGVNEPVRWRQCSTI